MISTLGFVFFATTVEVDMVGEDYYEEGVKYQQQIDRIQRTAALSEPVDYTVINDELNITLPDDFTPGAFTGEITFYRPDNGNRDFTVTMNQSLTQVVDLSERKSGKWVVELRWKADGKEYYDEHDLYLQ